MSARQMIIAALFAGYATGCMFNPLDESTIYSRTDPQFFDGWASAPSRVVEIQIFDNSNNSWTTVDTAVSTTTPEIDPSGDAWFYWSTEVMLPRSWRFWAASDDGQGLVRADGHLSGNESEMLCFIGAYLADIGAKQAYPSCVSPAKTSARVFGNDDIDGLLGAYDKPVRTNITDWPFNSGQPFINSLQGVSHDATYWYFTSSRQGGQLARIPRAGNLNNFSGYNIVGNFFENYDHPGDIDVHNGWLYVALEEPQSSVTPRYNAIGAQRLSSYSSSLPQHRRVFPLTTASPQRQGGTFPWIARDPQSGFFYSSLFSNTNKLQRYKATFNSSGEPTGFSYCGTVTLSQSLDRVQGGAFSPSGRLYLSTDPSDQASIDEGLVKVVEMGGHVLGLGTIDCATPPAVFVEVIDAIYIQKDNSSCSGGGEEIEGITVWDLDGGLGYQGRSLGQLHTLLVDCDILSNDDLYFKHTRITDHL